MGRQNGRQINYYRPLQTFNKCQVRLFEIENNFPKYKPLYVLEVIYVRKLAKKN